ncbi:sugar phosphate isomerase/epimerase [Gaiella sp.]|uniref:sugar phosphate isomerase/epimerase family protein n=1 Tax=Gaiella sp. TaxID=2663207 RepID=UPI00326673CC
MVVEARHLGLDFALLETSFLGEPDTFEPGVYLAEAGGLVLGLSWGAPDGFAFGDRPEALDELLAWLPPAAALGLHVMRIVAGGPAHRGRDPGPVTDLLREACAAALDHGVRLAIENHGDLTAEQVEVLLDRVGGGLAVCFDTANALRVGDDVTAAVRRLEPAIEIVHVKNCAGTWDDPAAGPLTLAPGEGVIPMDAVLDACPRALLAVELGQLAPDADERVLVRQYVDYLRSR